MVVKRLRKLLGIDRFKMPVDCYEFQCLRPVLESHLSGGWNMGKTPQHSAIQVQLTGTHPYLEQHLKEIAACRGFEVEISYNNISGYYKSEQTPEEAKQV